MNRNIVCFGAEYVGGFAMAAIAKMDHDRKPVLVFDTRSSLNAVVFRGVGFKVINIGK